MPYTTITSLDSLLTAIRAGEIADLSDCPTFGGAEPADTRGVWSWDADRLLIGEGSADLRIVTRAEYAEMMGMGPALRADTPVRNSGGKTLVQWFDGNIARLRVGPSLGADDMQGAYDRWPVYEGDERVGTLFEDAVGTTYDAVDDDGAVL